MTESSDATAGGVLRGAITLSVGTGVVRGLSAASQLLLALWLAPAQFGLWAAALASLTFFTSIANFGEVNGYLSGRAPGFQRLVRSTRRQNLLLTAAAGIVVIVIWRVSGTESGILALMLALSIPLQGESDVFYALGVRQRMYGRLVWAQLAASIVKLGLGVAVAVLTASALALAVSTLVYYVVLLAVLRLLQGGTENDTEHLAAIPRNERATWAVNSLVMSLPLQIGFFVAQFVTNDAILGVYYLSFQISLGLSGLLAVPLARVALSAFGQSRGQTRNLLALDLTYALAATVAAIVGAVSIAALIAEPFVPDEWQVAVPVAILMLASLPVRLVAPVLEGFQQANAQWWQSTWFNVVETLASAALALALAVVDLRTFALFMVIWRLAFGVVRMCIVLRSAGRLRLFGAAALIFILTAAMTTGGWVGGHFAIGIFGGVIVASACSMAVIGHRILKRRSVIGTTHTERDDDD